MAVGTTIISASGLALGGVMGGVVANRYHGEDKSFAIRKLSDYDGDERTVFINGFTQEKEETFSDWQVGQFEVGLDHRLYGVNWSSGTRYDLGTAFGKGTTSKAAKSILQSLAMKGGQQAAQKLNPMGWLLLISQLASNPWHATMFRAAQAGVQLADALSRTRGQHFNLVGHSLGCRVIYYALEALASKQERFVGDVILLGGAIGRDDQVGWSNALSAVEGRLYNCYSKHDQVLDKIYHVANAGLSDPIGVKPILLVDQKLRNLDCSSFVESHMRWKHHYPRILRMISSNSC